MKAVDSHSHLYFEQFDRDREQVLNQVLERLEFVAVAGCDFEGNKKVVNLCRGVESLVPNLGLHPTSIEDFEKVESIKAYIKEEEPAAVGEIGLDHHHVKDKDVREIQEQVFREMLELAESLNLPVVVHSRQAEERALEVLEEYELEVFMHCFNGSLDLLQECVDRGFRVGVTTQVLYSSHVQSIAEELPLDSMLLETDSPFLYPEGRNEPVKVLESAEKIADLKELEKEQVVETTTGKARDTFL